MIASAFRDGYIMWVSCFLQEFNKGLFDFLIATDDVHSASHDCEADEDGAHPDGSPEEAAMAGGSAEAARSGGAQKKGKKRKQRTERDEEFGVTRCD